MHVLSFISQREKEGFTMLEKIDLTKKMGKKEFKQRMDVLTVKLGPRSP